LSIQNIEYALFNKYGEVIRGVSRLTDNGNATMQTEDGSPVLAPLSDGHIGITWHRWILDQSNSKSNYNIYFAILDAAGNLVYGPANITNNSAFSSFWSDLNVLQYYNPRLAATGDNRFVLTWEGRMNVAPSGSCTSNCDVADVYCAILDANGATVKSITKFTNSTAGGSIFYSPATTALSTNRALLAYITSNYNIAYAILDSGGGIIKGETNLGQKGYGLVARQLSDGRTILAWHTEASPYTGIQFAILDSAYNLLSGPTALDNPAAPPNNAGWIGSSLSVASDSNGHAILTWGDTDIRNRPNLYYALVDGAGSILTPPMIFRSSQASSPYIGAGSQGQGNTTYSSITTGADGVVNFSSPLFGGAPGGGVAMNISYANHGLTTITGAVLTATLGSSSLGVNALSTSGLTYLGDTSGITPTVTGNTIVWSLPPLNFLDGKQFDLNVGVPVSATIGTLYSVTLTLTSDQTDVNPDDNVDLTDVMAARQLFLPLVRR
jgi:hypothetical protein